MLSSLVVALSMVAAQPGTPAQPSFLFNIETSSDRAINLRGECYHPQAGDLVFFDSHSDWMRRLYNCCGTSTPSHVGVVLRNRNGSWAILEAGPNAVWKVFIFDLDERLRPFDGTILIRRLKTPLTPDQSQHLTEFSLAQEGKAYALGRLMLQGTPIRSHGTLRSQLFGRTVLDRDRWICSELATAALTVAGVLDAASFPANAMYPRDLCYDERHDLSPYFESAALWYPRPQLDFVGNGVRIQK
jgi:hypothetical protein